MVRLGSRATAGRPAEDALRLVAYSSDQVKTRVSLTRHDQACSAGAGGVSEGMMFAWQLLTAP